MRQIYEQAELDAEREMFAKIEKETIASWAKRSSAWANEAQRQAEIDARMIASDISKSVHTQSIINESKQHIQKLKEGLTVKAPPITESKQSVAWINDYIVRNMKP